MPESRLERTRRAYDRVIDMGPMGCKILDVGAPDNRALNAVWNRQSWRARHLNAADQLARQAPKAPLYWNVIEGEHFSTDRDPGDEA